jgi:hypothetical protein
MHSEEQMNVEDQLRKKNRPDRNMKEKRGKQESEKGKVRVVMRRKIFKVFEGIGLFRRGVTG